MIAFLPPFFFFPKRTCGQYFHSPRSLFSPFFSDVDFKEETLPHCIPFFFFCSVRPIGGGPFGCRFSPPPSLFSNRTAWVRNQRYRRITHAKDGVFFFFFCLFAFGREVVASCVSLPPLFFFPSPVPFRYYEPLRPSKQYGLSLTRCQLSPRALFFFFLFCRRHYPAGRMETMFSPFLSFFFSENLFESLAFTPTVFFPPKASADSYIAGSLP